MPPQPGLLDTQLRQALGLHQANRFAEAEALYRQVLAFRPDLAEVHVNCALAQFGQGKYGEAEVSLQRAIAAQPGAAKAHLHMGDALSFQNRFEEAMASYRRAVRLKPDYAEAYNNLGNALLHRGEREQARAAYRKAIALKPDYAQAHNNLGNIHLWLGDFEDARAEFARALAIAPGYAEAQNNLGNALHKLERSDEAQAAFRAAIRLAPGYADAYINLSTCLSETGKAVEAEAAAAEGVRLSPGAPEAHNALGNALRQQGKLAEAQASYREALACKPDFSEAQRRLAETLCEDNRLADAFAVYTVLAERAHGGDPAGSDVAHKQRHDSEQQAWLGGKAPSFYLADGNRVAGPAVNPAGRLTQISEAGKPQIVVIDDLLTAEALEKLRRFCMDSTIWREIYDDGYLGAFPQTGFAPLLLAQIAEELRAAYPAVIGGHPLLHFWAFKYDSSLRGTGVHADFAAVNVNFWITPDDANLDPDHGGLVVWDAAAPLDWDFAKYNAADGDIRAFLEQEKARPVIVPYRANRAVVFDSDLFHETDTIHFKPGYENRRINVTLLFGHRQARRP
ncbi:MAG TPA: tetratricopeptide repeat protein [Rhizomicrobium sp.]|nr:tetratricopeptide repeat protein [Rhizomicrobium sp.]